VYFNTDKKTVGKNSADFLSSYYPRL